MLLSVVEWKEIETILNKDRRSYPNPQFSGEVFTESKIFLDKLEMKFVDGSSFY